MPSVATNKRFVRVQIPNDTHDTCRHVAARERDTPKPIPKAGNPETQKHTFFYAQQASFFFFTLLTRSNVSISSAFHPEIASTADHGTTESLSALPPEGC